MPDVFSVMEENASSGRVRISYGQLSVKTGFDVRKIRHEIRKLAQNGYVSIDKITRANGTVFCEYTLNVTPKADGASIIKILFCELAGERAGQSFDPLYQFNGFSHVFEKVGKLCVDLGLNEAVYVLSIFHSFPENWCIKTFKQSFPPPYLFLNIKHAKDRYATFERFIYQHAKPEKSRNTTKRERLAEERRVWEMCGRPKNPTTLNLMTKNGTLSKETVNAILKGKE